MKKLLRPGRFFILAGVFLLLTLNVSAQISRPRLVNPKVDDVAGMIIVKPDPTIRSREVKRKHRNKVLPRAVVKRVKAPVKTKTNAPTKTKNKEGNLKPMATAKKKPAAKKPAAKKAAPKKAAAKKPAAKKAAPKKAAAKKPAAKKPAAKKKAAPKKK